MIGTTHFTNAVVQRKDLAPTAAVRLGLPATASLVPMVDWPQDLREAIGGQHFLAHGGFEFDGREISAFDHAEIEAIGREIAARGIRSVAVSSVFSPVNTEMEKQAGEVLQQILGEDAHLTLSSDIGRLGLLERENAAIMNACLRDLASTTVQAFRDALLGVGIDAPFFLTQNDGTLMSAETAERFPGADLRERTDQLDARRGLPVGHQGRDRHRRRRHHHRRRRAARRLPARGRRGGRGGRGAHQLPHAGRVLDRSGRRLARDGRRRVGGDGRAPQRRLSPAAGGPRVRRLDADRDRRRRGGRPRRHRGARQRRPPERGVRRRRARHDRRDDRAGGRTDAPHAPSRSR